MLKYIFFVIFFCLFLHRLAVRIILTFHIFLQVELYWSRSTTERSGTTHWLLWTYWYFIYLESIHYSGPNWWIWYISWKMLQCFFKQLKVINYIGWNIPLKQLKAKQTRHASVSHLWQTIEYNNWSFGHSYVRFL